MEKGLKLLPREQYRQIKSMSREEMTTFLHSYGTDLVNDALDEQNAIDYDELRTELSKIKGIGATRLDEIMRVIENIFVKEN